MCIASSVDVGPGIRFAAPRRPRKVASSSQALRRTNSSRISATWAAGPPNDVRPRRRKTAARPTSPDSSGRGEGSDLEGERGRSCRGRCRGRGPPWPPWPGPARRSAPARRSSRPRCAAGRSRTAPAGPRGCRSARTRRCRATGSASGSQRATMSGRALIQSVAATIGPPSPGSTCRDVRDARGPWHPGGAGSSARPRARRGAAAGTTGRCRPRPRRRTARPAGRAPR